MKQCDILVVGGGASGLAAAIEAKRQNGLLSVIICERLPRVGKKILATGNGRCNLGNLNDAAHPYRNASFAATALQKYGAESAVDFFESMGLFTRADSQGRLYPLSNYAASVLDALRLEAQRLGVETLCGFGVSKIVPEKGGFAVNGEIRAKKVIVAGGGKAAPSQGSDGSCYPLLQALGHTVTPLAPSLVQLLTDTAKTRALKGVRAHARLSLSTGGCSEGEILFTEYGLSGIASMDLSRFAPEKKSALLTLDFLPEFDLKKVERIISDFAALNPDLPAENLLSGLVHKTLGAAVIKAALGLTPPAAKALSGSDIKKIAYELKSFTLEFKGTKGFTDAQVTRGGAEINEFNPDTMQSKKLAGLYACGEVLDVDGACGGFNLAWAFASGRLAGENAAKR